jgi:hypothetical protein
MPRHEPRPRAAWRAVTVEDPDLPVLHTIIKLRGSVKAVLASTTYTPSQVHYRKKILDLRSRKERDKLVPTDKAIARTKARLLRQWRR